MLRNPNLQVNKYPEIIPIEEERTIQETISRKSTQVNSKIRYRLVEVTQLDYFMTTEVKSLENKNTILYIMPATAKNFTSDFFDSHNKEGAKFYYLNPNGNHSPFFENYFVLSSPFIAIFQNGEKITEIPLAGRQSHDIEFEKIAWIVNNSIQNIIEHGLRRGINLISTKIRSNADSGGSSNADSLDFGKGLRLGSNQILKDSHLKRVTKEYESLRIDSEEEKHNIDGEVGGITLGGNMMQQRLSRGFSFMPSSLNSSVQGSGKDIIIRHNRKGGVIVERVVGRKKERVPLRTMYLELIEQFFSRNEIDAEQFLLYSLYVGLKKCSVGRLGRLADSGHSKILGHFIEIDKNERLREFLGKYYQKIKCTKLFPLLKIMNIVHPSQKTLMKNKKEILKQFEKLFKRRTTFQNFITFIHKFEKPPLAKIKVKVERRKRVPKIHQQLKSFLDLRANQIFNPDQMKILLDLYEKKDGYLQAAFSQFCNEKDEADFIDTLHRLILKEMRKTKPPFETPKGKQRYPLPIRFPHQKPPNRAALNQTTKKRNSLVSSPSSSGSFLEHDATEESSFMKKTIKSPKGNDDVSNSNTETIAREIVKPKLIRRRFSNVHSFIPQDLTSELADLVPNQEGMLLIPQKKANINGFRSIQFEESSNYTKPAMKESVNMTSRMSQNNLIMDSSEEKKEIRSLPKTMRDSSNLFRVNRNSSPPDNFSVAARINRTEEYLNSIQENYLEKSEAQQSDEPQSSNCSVGQFELNLVKFVFDQMKVHPEITLMHENIITGVYDDFKLKDVILDYAKHKIIKILTNDTDVIKINEVEMILQNKNEFIDAFSTDLSGKEALESVTKKVKSKIDDVLNEEVTEVISRSKNSRSSPKGTLVSRKQAITSHFNYKLSSHNFELSDRKDSGNTNHSNHGRSKSRTNLKYKKAEKFAKLTIDTTKLDQKTTGKRRLKKQKSVIRPQIVKKDPEDGKTEVVEKAHSVVSNYSMISKVYFSNEDEGGNMLHDLYEDGHFSMKNMEKVLKEMVQEANENGVKITEEQFEHLTDQLQMNFSPLLNAIHTYRHRKMIPDLSSPVFNKEFRNKINKLKITVPETLTMITHNFEQRRSHSTIFLSLLNYLKNNLQLINQRHLDFFMHLLHTEDLRLLSAYEVYIVREELDDFVDTLFLIFQSCCRDRDQRVNDESTYNLREKQNNILFQYKKRIKKPIYKKLIEMVKKGDEQTFELYEKYCKGNMSHFGVKGGKNVDGRVTFVQELEAYTIRAIKRERQLNKKKRKEMKKMQSNPEDHWKLEYLRYASIYMSQSGLKEDDLHLQAYKDNPGSAHGIVECYQMTNDRGALEESIIVFVDCYLKKNLCNNSEFYKGLLKNGIEPIVIYKIDKVFHKESHPLKKGLKETKELYEVIFDDEEMMSSMKIILSKLD